MSNPTTLGVRMKQHEHAYRRALPRRTYTLLRLDGRAFHSYTRGLVRPFDAQFAVDMDATGAALCAEITGTAFAYVQSDEISLLLTDFATPTTQPWMGGIEAKILSLSAALASATFNRLRPPVSPQAAPALFDARLWTLDDPAEVTNYFLWRQRDAVKNSISMAASTHFSHRRLDRLNSTHRLDLRHTEAGIDWHDYDPGFRRGRVIARVARDETITFVHSRTAEKHIRHVTRSHWAATPAPEFTHAPDGWLAQSIPAAPTTLEGGPS